ncbi:hypothetical protein C8Q79DRAFT_397400 [Trametes meyenii]|nr:hypothetical protein C8Q79DRAFT_397400 [Trametes meyenii]
MFVPDSCATATVEPLRYGDISTAVRTTWDAMYNDSLSRYFREVDTFPGMEARHKVILALGYADQIYRGVAWTIDHGSAILTMGIPGHGRGVLPMIVPLLKLFYTRELDQRQTEVAKKLAKMLETAFGNRLEDMIEVGGLATTPAKQGLGYGTMLMHFVNDWADKQNRAVWLFTTDAYEFYETVGYSVIQEDVAGADDPTWEGEPVPLRIMFRAPKNVTSPSPEKVFLRLQ